MKLTSMHRWNHLNTLAARMAARFGKSASRRVPMAPFQMRTSRPLGGSVSHVAANKTITADLADVLYVFSLVARSRVHI